MLPTDKKTTLDGNTKAGRQADEASSKLQLSAKPT